LLLLWSTTGPLPAFGRSIRANLRSQYSGRVDAHVSTTRKPSGVTTTLSAAPLLERLPTGRPDDNPAEAIRRSRTPRSRRRRFEPVVRRGLLVGRHLHIYQSVWIRDNLTPISNVGVMEWVSTAAEGVYGGFPTRIWPMPTYVIRVGRPRPETNVLARVCHHLARGAQILRHGNPTTCSRFTSPISSLESHECRSHIGDVPA